MIGRNIKVVGVFATNPDMKLIVKNKITYNIIGFMVSNGISSKISPKPASKRHPTTTYNDIKKNNISQSTSLNISLMVSLLYLLFTKTRIKEAMAAVKYNKGKRMKRARITRIEMLLK